MGTKERISTDNLVCNYIVDILIAQGVKHAVVSPGSRNAPMIVALSRCADIKKYVVVDERSAAFIAVGLAQQLDAPVALVCTSGSAVLNYAPAIAEAYYQRLPLIVISADRQKEWIDQNDSQTIIQNGILRPIVKSSFDIPSRCEEKVEKWYANRLINEAVIKANSVPKGPVHINIQLGEPLCNTAIYSEKVRLVDDVKVEKTLAKDTLDKLTAIISKCKSVMVLATMTNGSVDRLNNALNRFAERSNVIILTETISNLKSENYISTIDRVLSAMPKDKRNEYEPELLITFGGAPVTRMLKQYLRSRDNMQHWHIDESDNVIDTMQHLTKKIRISPEIFFEEINNQEFASSPSVYKEYWHSLRHKATLSHEQFVKEAEWCDLKAFSIILSAIPVNYNLQLSNGTSIRYAQLFETPNIKKSNCNRGVAGIDGSTSTALGASLAKGENTVLITGDMSLSYDLNGMASRYNNQQFKIVVICNGGGGIFRFIKGPSDLEELEEYFEVHNEIPVEKHADTFGYNYYSAYNEDDLKDNLKRFFESKKASILAVFTPPEINADVLRKYFRRNK